MAPIPMGGVVVVTGSTGYIGSHIVAQLLQRGYSVRACVRSRESSKCDFLKALPQVVTGRLTLHACNIDESGVFDEVCKGAHGFIHTADQLMSSGGEEKGHTTSAHPERAMGAIRNIIGSVNKSGSVVRVVYTSSIAAMVHESDLSQFEKRPLIWDGRLPGEQFTQAKYKENLAANGYAVAKIMTEQTLTAAAELSGGLWDAIIANPGDNYGPVLAAHQLSGGGGGFPNNIRKIMTGKKVAMLSAYHPMWMVDVRDTAAGHINMLESTVVRNGDRHLLLNKDKVLMEDLVRLAGQVFQDSPIEPTKEAEDNLPEAVQKRATYFRKLWHDVQLRNDGALRIGTSFRPSIETVRDTAESLIAVCGIKPRLRSSL